MFLRATVRKKDGNERTYFSVAESKRVADGRVMQRHALYLGEINSSQELAWHKSIEVLDEVQKAPRTLALFPDDRYEAVVDDETVVRLRLARLRLEQPRQWGGCWLALQLWRQLELDEFWAERLPPSRKSTRWDQVLPSSRSRTPMSVDSAASSPRPQPRPAMGHRTCRRSACTTYPRAAAPPRTCSPMFICP
jgi:hypothetical protein